ncbi:alkaline phosphatase [Bacterioplanes sanyensis]|uniref:Alkaline phosphatase n=1 Tax=Bacterioplanes sanyensis TaxID=1249553 RepID=A0A222FH96_9GAMM|nr:choice-of-anchor I family protein [Bacterioplanes sanyensis]ASP38002.1 alkaline phosphatase [Bacterioplanes sanyensis]
MTTWTQRTLLLAMSAALAACGSDSNDSDRQSPLQQLGIQCQTSAAAAPLGAGTLTLSLVDSYQSGNAFDSASAEIVSYDACSDRLYVVNANDKTVDVLSLASANSAPQKAGQIDLNSVATAAGISIGAANSVSTAQGLVAVAIEAANKQDPGLLALYRSDDLSLLATYPAGSLPDMVSLSSDGRYLLSANEGEPSGDYSNDPEGSVTIVDLANGFTADQAQVKQVRFDGFNQGNSRHAELGSMVRLAGPAGTSVAQDLEPEYLTLASNGKAYVALQENNALAIIDVASARVDTIKGLGLKPWDAASGNQLDASNRDAGTGQFASYELLTGLYMPDTIASVNINGQDYVLSANEGDGREYLYSASQAVCDAAGHLWDGDAFQPGGEDEDANKYQTELDDCIAFIDEARGGDLQDRVADDHPLKAALGDNDQLKRLKFVTDQNSIAATEPLMSFGARSFSIWNANGELVFDSGDDIAKRVFASEGDYFNATNDVNLLSETADNRSDDKGIEPEAIEVAQIGERTFVFVGLERQGGIIVYDISIPSAPVFQSYLNHRDFTAPVCTEVNDDGECDNDTYNPAAGDLGPESIEYFSRGGEHWLAVGNEVSGTTSVYRLSSN